MKPLTPEELAALQEVRRRLMAHQRQTILAEVMATGRNYRDSISQGHQEALRAAGIPEGTPSGTREDPGPPLPPATSEADSVLNTYRSLFGFEAVQAVLHQMAAENN